MTPLYSGFYPHILFALLTYGLLSAPSPLMASVDPEDILIVFNNNSDASQDVARYYAAKRSVPEDNLIGLSLPENESISRSQYEEFMVPPLRKKAEHVFAKKRLPLFLLVYGVPLKIGTLQPPDVPQKEIHDAEMEALKLAALLRQLSIRLLTITDPAYIAPSAAEDTAEEKIQKALELSFAAISRMAEWEKSESAKNHPQAGLVDEALSIFYRLVGISRIAENMMKRAGNHKEMKISPKENPLVLWGVTLERRLTLMTFHGFLPETMGEFASLTRAGRGLTGELLFWKEMRERNFYEETSASVDSELTMMNAPAYSRAKWLPNPFLAAFDSVPGIEDLRSRTPLTARLDGPTPEIAKRLVDDALQAEAEGLKGVFYIDARWPRDNKEDGEYAKFDSSLHNLFDFVTEKTTMKAILDDRPELFSKPCCPDGALYCGWYSLRKYVDGVEWRKGAVGYHVASGEAATLRSAESTVWCKRMLEEGIAATLGPVEEPYLQSFPRPDQFFPLLMTGKLVLAEIYFRTIPFLSWRQVLVGDPLYNPFKNNPVISASE